MTGKANPLGSGKRHKRICSKNVFTLKMHVLFVPHATLFRIYLNVKIFALSLGFMYLSTHDTLPQKGHAAGLGKPASLGTPPPPLSVLALRPASGPQLGGSSSCHSWIYTWLFLRVSGVASSTQTPPCASEEDFLFQSPEPISQHQ